ncbi:hypothetical protein [Crossiella sp. CA198]|uniref:hypothetical protein n=1 Tax=Crossiella sp. CA198 TaxID=3455607 RepID=UPI003F8D52AF
MTSEPPRLCTADERLAYIAGLRAGTAAIRGISPVLGRLAGRCPAGRPDGPEDESAVMVPFLVVDEQDWRRATTGEPLSRLISLLHREGGFWLAENLDGRVRWCAAPVGAVTEDGVHRDPDTGEVITPWLRLDITCTGPWHGSFAFSAPATDLAPELWLLGGSPVFGIVTEPLGRPGAGRRTPVLDLDTFEIRLNRSLHLRADPPRSVRQLVIDSGWPGAEQLAGLAGFSGADWPF